MKNILFTLLLILFGSMTFVDERPNILLIMVDDMGYSDLGCFGSEIKMKAEYLLR